MRCIWTISGLSEIQISLGTLYFFLLNLALLLSCLVLQYCIISLVLCHSMSHSCDLRLSEARQSVQLLCLTPTSTSVFLMLRHQMPSTGP